MKMNVRIGQIHPDRRSVADEMNVVPASSQFLAELRSHDARAAVRGVAGDADAHEPGKSPKKGSDTIPQVLLKTRHSRYNSARPIVG